MLEGVDCMNVSWLYAVCYFYLLCYNVTMIYILYVLYFNHCDAVRLFALWYILFIRIVRNLIYILSYTADHVEVCGSSVGSRPMHGWFKAPTRLAQVFMVRDAMTTMSFASSVTRVMCMEVQAIQWLCLYVIRTFLNYILRSEPHYTMGR